MCGCNKQRSLVTRSTLGSLGSHASAASTSILGRIRNRYSSANNGRNPVPGSMPIPRSIPVPATDPSRWGPPLWKMLHILAFATSVSGLDLSGEWNTLFQDLQKELPCDVCRGHAQEWLRKNPVIPRDIQPFVANFHNDVNARRRVPLWTIQQVVSTYSAGGKEKQISLVPMLLSSVSMMPGTTRSLQSLLASVS